MRRRGDRLFLSLQRVLRSKIFCSATTNRRRLWSVLFCQDALLSRVHSPEHQHSVCGLSSDYLVSVLFCQHLPPPLQYYKLLWCIIYFSRTFCVWFCQQAILDETSCAGQEETSPAVPPSCRETSCRLVSMFVLGAAIDCKMIFTAAASCTFLPISLLFIFDVDLVHVVRIRSMGTIERARSCCLLLYPRPLCCHRSDRASSASLHRNYYV